MKITPLPFLKIAFLFCVVLLPKSSQAGLIIEIPEEIDISQITKLDINEDGLYVHFEDGNKHQLRLPENALPYIVVWAIQECTGPFVFSIDGALVPGAENFAPSCIPQPLASVFFEFDVYAHELANGYVPDNVDLHPLVSKNGNIDLLPHRQYSKLMDPSNSSSEAVWYRRMTQKYISKPGVIGEITVIAKPSSSGFPVKTSAISHRWFRPHVWHREVDVPSLWDHRVLDQPYIPLRKDIDNRWEEYRKAFTPLDELSSIVETYAILKAILEKNPTLWNDFIRLNQKKIERFSSYLYDSYYHTLSPTLSSRSFVSEPSWSDQSYNNLGNNIRTTAEGDLALNWLWEYRNDDLWAYDPVIPTDKKEQWLVALEKLAEDSPRIKAKLLLYKSEAIEDEENGLVHMKEFFKFTRRHSELFRLRVMGYNLFYNRYSYDYDYDDYNEELGKFFSNQRRLILNDFIEEVKQYRSNEGYKDPNTRLFFWENLSQNVYSTALLEIAEDEYGYYSGYAPDFAEQLAFVHYQRGKEPQIGFELAYRHAHFRFLKYLLENSEQNDHLSQKVNSYRLELADLMGIKNWQTNTLDELINYDNAYDGYEYEEGNDGEGIVESSIMNTAITIEGNLSSVYSQFNLKNNSQSLQAVTENGIPVGVKNKNQFILILVDSRLFYPLAKEQSIVHVRVKGISHDQNQSITPLFIEYKNGDEWEVFDLPFSGVSGPFSLTNDQ